MNRREGWVGTEEIAHALRCSVATVRRSFKDPEAADRLYGLGNWTDEPSPVGRKKAFQVRESVIDALARKAGFA